MKPPIVSSELPPFTSERARIRFSLLGVIQGVGFRPFVYRLATELGLAGWVRNSTEGVDIEVEGHAEALKQFIARLRADAPPHSRIQELRTTVLPPTEETSFAVLASDTVGNRKLAIVPDLATCQECRTELTDPRNRRYRYPFINCTHCGPRYSIIESLPYDRARTTHKKFSLCAQCRTEYEDPRDRRFHAQPIACAECGPHLELWTAAGEVLATHEEAIAEAAVLLRSGGILAVKGVGGFHLLVDARDVAAVRKLRQRKAREHKPFAVMFTDLQQVQEFCEVNSPEQVLLTSAAAPIVLLRKIHPGLADSVAPGNPCLGCLLPYSPLHFLLLNELRFPVVATSGNRADEPICSDEQEALIRLKDVADLFLVHNRPIARPLDDSVVKVVMEHELVLRHARGYAPSSFVLPRSVSPLLAVGAQQKCALAFAMDRIAVLGQHLGDLDTEEAMQTFENACGDLPRLYDAPAPRWVCDLHPDYQTTRMAKKQSQPVLQVQHHHAHVLSAMMEYGLQAPVLGIAWDGTGFGIDGTVWGGEFLHFQNGEFERVAHFRLFPLPGGERAIREPRRAALGLLYAHFGDARFEMYHHGCWAHFSNQERALLTAALRQKINSPMTSSVGRLFDAVASILGLRQVNQFEGQAAMDLEFACGTADSEEAYSLPLTKDDILDWGPMMMELLQDRDREVPIAEMVRKFHQALVEAAVTVARAVGEPRVVLSGGCFQNGVLLKRTVERLQAEGFEVYWQRRVPPNDGGIALGQLGSVILNPGD